MSAEISMNPIIVGGDRSEPQLNCFICWRGAQDGVKLEPLTAQLKCGYRHLSESRSSNRHPNLNNNLSVVFLLRKVLGLPQNALISLLGNCGGDSGVGGDGGGGGDNPVDWGSKLCTSCGVILKECHFLYRRLIKIQQDFEGVASELRETLAESEHVDKETVEEETMTGLSPPKRRRGPGRPTSKKSALLKKITGSVEASKMEEMGNPVTFLRTKFIQCSKENTLEISSPKLLYTTTPSKGNRGSDRLSFLNGIQTTAPVHLTVKVTAQDFLSANRTPSVNLPPLQKVPVTTSPKQPGSPQPPPPENIQVPPPTPPITTEEGHSSSLLIKREIHFNVEDDPQDNPLDNFDNHKLHLTPPSPENEPEPEKDPLWAPDDDLHQDNPTDNEDDPANDSDFTPSSPTKKRDKRFTRKKPNLKENQRHKDLRTVKALSLSKAPTDTEGPHFQEPLKILEQSDHIIYKCPQANCDLTFPKKFECHIHHLRDHLEDPMPYHCHVCTGKRFLKEAYFRKHMVRYHLSARSPYDSDYSPSLHSASHLKSLITSNLPSIDSSGSENEDSSKIPGIPQIPPEILQKFTSTSEGSPFLCSHPGCPRKFSNEMLRDGHFKKNHLGIQKSFSCSLCPLSFLRRTRLLEHLAIAHFSNQHSCPQCGARFADKVLLQGHIGRAHLGEKNPFKCPHCPSRFIRRTKMDMHMFKKHQVPLPKGPLKRKVPARCIPLPKLHPLKAKKCEGPSGVIEPPPPKKCWICHSTSDRLPQLFDTVDV